jgi:hypothetical protein
MDSIIAIGAALPSCQTRPLANPDADPAPYALLAAAAEPNTAPVLGSAQDGNTATQQQLTLHFISHIDAECFISLLQTMDPLPADSRAQAEYKRFYHHLRDSLEVPLPPQEPQPPGVPSS